MAANLAPIVCLWQRHLLTEAVAKGHTVETRRSRVTGSTMWRIDGGRWIPTGPASRKMEIIIYGRPNP